MPFTFNNVKKIVAVFTIIGSFLLIAMIIFILRGSKIFVSKDVYYTYFHETYNLTSGTPIKFKGVYVGKVRDLELLKDYSIKVSFYIFSEYRFLARKDSVLKPSSTLLGSSGLVLTFLTAEESGLVEPGSQILSSDMKQGQEILVKLVGSRAKTDDLTFKAQQVLDMILEQKPLISETVFNMRTITEEIQLLVAGINGQEGSTTGKEMRESIKLLNENLVELKYVLRNFPLVSRKKQKQRQTSLSSGDR